MFLLDPPSGPMESIRPDRSIALMIGTESIDRTTRMSRMDRSHHSDDRMAATRT
jgi:hypothetical protein